MKDNARRPFLFLAIATVLAIGCSAAGSAERELETGIEKSESERAVLAAAASASSTSPADRNDSIEPDSSVSLVTIEGNDAGWALIDGSSQWVAPECRAEIEATGTTFEVVAWEVIESTVDSDRQRSCDELLPSQVAPVGAGSIQVGLQRGINFAGDFEVDPRGSWGQPILDEDFARAAAAGFDHVRVPVRWSSYTGAAPDFAIAPAFLAEVDHLIDLAHASGLTIVIDVHHFEELDADPAGERARYLAIWRQLSVHYQDQPASVVFELLNEPIGVFNDQPELWNELAEQALDIVRANNPTRTVIIGPVSYNHADRLDDLRLPDDPNLVATIHTYDPDSFTVQGAVFIDPIPATGLTWNADDASISFDWQQQSWDVALDAGPNGLAIEWARPYAAFGVGSFDGTETADEVRIEASDSFEAVVLCNYSNDVREIGIDWDGATGTADVSECGPLTSLALQYVGAEPRPVTLSRFAACSVSCDEVIVTQRESLESLIGGAATWASEQNVPLYIGEFGVYDSRETPVDPASRFAWTNAVRTIAEEHGAGWAYFAMSDEFGAYDRANERWLPEVVDALLD